MFMRPPERPRGILVLHPYYDIFRVIRPLESKAYKAVFAKPSYFLVNVTEDSLTKHLSGTVRKVRPPILINT